MIALYLYRHQGWTSLSTNNDLFSALSPMVQPLAAALRPTSLEEYVGQEHLLGAGKPLRKAIEAGQLHSMVLWGPPGVGKTTLARLIAHYTEAHFLTLSAVLSGVKDIRAAVETAQQQRVSGRNTILFVDEVHRFNKAQQDAFLPHVEDGTIIFIGATTENPSFELNNALLSRARVYVLRNLTQSQIESLIERGLAKLAKPDKLFLIDEDARQLIAHAADGDARRALTLLEIASDLAEPSADGLRITKTVLEEVLVGDVKRFDKGGDIFYEQISALHKAVRGSSPDAALYWLVRMLDGGCDPLYIARRVVRMASEDIGNADPRGLNIALDAWQVQERLGSPEGELAIAQAVTYLACAAKSNAVYSAYKNALKDVKQNPSYEVPLHLRNAPTALMKELSYGDEYRYAHDETDGFAAGESYFPEELAGSQYYFPVARGLEAKIREKLNHLRELDATSDNKRYSEVP